MLTRIVLPSVLKLRVGPHRLMEWTASMSRRLTKEELVEQFQLFLKKVTGHTKTDTNKMSVVRYLCPVF